MPEDLPYPPGERLTLPAWRLRLDDGEFLHSLGLHQLFHISKSRKNSAKVSIYLLRTDGPGPILHAPKRLCYPTRACALGNLLPLATLSGRPRLK